MEKREYEGLHREMQKLGSILDLSMVELAVRRGDEIIQEHYQFGGADKMDDLNISWHLKNARLIHYEATLKKHIDIPKGIIAGINMQDLDDRMSHLDWSKGYLNDNVFFLSVEEANKIIPLFEGIRRDLYHLHDKPGDGQQAFYRFALKYFLDTPNTEAIPGFQRLQAQYEKKMIANNDLRITVEQAYNLLDGRAVLKKMGDPGRGAWDWYMLNQSKKSEDGYMLLEGLPQARGFIPIQELKGLGYVEASVPGSMWDVRELGGGAKIEVSLQLDGARAQRVVYADPAKGVIQIDKDESEARYLYHVPDRKLYEGRYRGLKKTLGDLNISLLDIGVPALEINKAMDFILTHDKSYELGHREKFGEDIVDFQVAIKRVGLNAYGLDYIDARLVKWPAPSHEIINGVKIAHLIERMERVDWNLDFSSQSTRAFNLKHQGGFKQEQEAVDHIVADLVKLATGPHLKEGSAIAQALGHQYFIGTPNIIIPTQWSYEGPELTRRVRFLGKPELSLEALYNLMNNRYAMGERYSPLGELEAREWYQLNVMAFRGAKPAISAVSGKFSVDDALKQYVPAQYKKNLLNNDIVEQLEKGAVRPIYIAAVKEPILVFADPVKKTLVVDFGATLLSAGHNPEGQRMLNTKISLGDFVKIVEKSQNWEDSMSQINKLSFRSRPGGDDDGNEKGQSRKR